MEIAERLDLPARGAPGPLLRRPAQGRGLLEQRGPHVRAVRHRRPRAQARVLVRRLDQHAPSSCATPRGTWPPTRRASRAPASCCAPCARIRARGRPTSTRRAATAARASCADARLLGRRRRGRAGARRALGRQRAPGRPAGRRDPADLAHHLPGPDGRGLHVGRRARGGASRSSARGAGAGSTPRSPTCSWRSAPTTPSGCGWSTTRRPRCCATSSRASRARPRRRGRASTASPRRSPGVIDAKSPYTARHSLGRRDLRGGDRPRGWASTTIAAALPAPRRPAARHRQARRLEPDPRQARQADRRRVRGGAPPPALHLRRSCPASPPSPTSPRPPRPTTSASTGAATTAASARSTCRPRRASWRWPTSSTRSRPTAPTAARSTRTSPSRSSGRTPARPSTRVYIAALAGSGDRGRLRRLSGIGGRRVTTPRRRIAVPDRQGTDAVATIYVTGHRNPDMDSIASAIGYAELKGRLDSANALRAGAARRDQRAGPLGAGAQRRARARAARPRDAAGAAT